MLGMNLPKFVQLYHADEQKKAFVDDQTLQLQLPSRQTQEFNNKKAVQATLQSPDGQVHNVDHKAVDDLETEFVALRALGKELEEAYRSIVSQSPVRK